MIAFSKGIARRPFAIGMAIGLMVTLGMWPATLGSAAFAGPCDPELPPPATPEQIDSVTGFYSSLSWLMFGVSDVPPTVGFILDAAYSTSATLVSGRDAYGNPFTLTVEWYSPEQALSCGTGSTHTHGLIGKMQGAGGYMVLSGCVITGSDQQGSSRSVFIPMGTFPEGWLIYLHDYGTTSSQQPQERLQGTLSACQRNCIDDFRAHRNLALTVFAIAIAAIAVELGGTVAACLGYSLPGFPVGAVVGAACVIAAMARALLAFTAASVLLAAAMAVCVAALNSCMAGCGGGIFLKRGVSLSDPNLFIDPPSD